RAGRLNRAGRVHSSGRAQETANRRAALMHTIWELPTGKRQKKRPERRGPGLCNGKGVWQAPLSDLLVEGDFDWLIGVLGQADIHLTELGHLRDVGVVGLLGILGLDLDGLLDRLRADQLLESAR